MIKFPVGVTVALKRQIPSLVVNVPTWPGVRIEPSGEGEFANGVTRFQPIVSIVRISAPVTRFSTPEEAKALNESNPALPAQSPESPPPLLKLLRFVFPPSGEKYPPAPRSRVFRLEYRNRSWSEYAFVILPTVPPRNATRPSTSEISWTAVPIKS